ncbi:MAG: MFS transporter [Propionibacteriaceae bacterium]|jgi:MFS family permease|nr:MFS transporter [Propionibacteriaceae bacterium]
MELLRHRPFAVLLAARTLNMLGFAFEPVALAFGILHLTGNDKSFLSVVLVAQTLPEVLLTLFGGVVADRLPRVWVLRVGQSINFVSWVSMGVLMLMDVRSLWAYCPLAVMGGVASAVIYPALTGIIPEMTPAPLLQQGNSWLAMGMSIAKLFGLIAAGTVVAFLGGGVAMIIAGSIYICGVGLTMMLPALPAPAGTTESMVRQLAAGWGEFRSRQWLWVSVLALSVIVMMLQAAHGVLGPYLAETELGGPEAWAKVLAGEATGAILGVLVSFLWKPKRPIFAGVLLLLFWALPTTLLGLKAALWWAVIAMFFAGFGYQIFSVQWATAMQTQVPADKLSRVAAYDAFGSICLGPLGLIIATPVSDAIGIHNAMIGCGAVLFLVTLITLCAPGVRAVRATTRVVSIDGKSVRSDDATSNSTSDNT